MRVWQLTHVAVCLSALALAACGTSAPAPAASEQAAAASAPASAPSGTVTLPGGYPERPFVRVEFDKLTWRPTEGNTLGVETAIVEGDPSKPGYYLTINHFPAGVMSRPHYHPDERYIIVLRGTWYTDEGEVFRPNQTVPLKPGDFMRHPKGGPHYDGALDVGGNRRLRPDEGHRHRRWRVVWKVPLGSRELLALQRPLRLLAESTVVADEPLATLSVATKLPIEPAHGNRRSSATVRFVE
ncbi:MAG TPA: cupin domain-containing protein, partial [Vicinamibacterales bacterium]|nr:cupin domain-containing protein [Vicinamibacterales bacterium]